MADGILKRNSVIGLAEEVTEGTYVAPTDFVQPLEGFEVQSTKELLERAIITGELTRPSPRSGIRSVTGTLALEYKANGLEGIEPESDILMQSLLGSRRQIAARITTKAGNTTSKLQIEDADIGSLNVGDMIVILESGAHHPAFITAKDSTGGAANVDYSPAASGAPSDNVEISKSTTYVGSSSGHPSVSASVYWGDEILEKVLGARAASMSLDNFSTGQIASMNFSLQGLNFSQEDGSSSSPTYTTGLPPVLLGTCVYQDGTELPMNTFGMTVTNDLSQVRKLCSTQGVTQQLYVRRNIAGQLTPYKDDTTVTQNTLFENDTEYAVIVIAYTPSSTPGEIVLGSVCGIYLPQVKTVSVPVGDVEDVLIDAIEYQATGGTDGTSTDIYMGFV